MEETVSSRLASWVSQHLNTHIHHTHTQAHMVRHTCYILEKVYSGISHKDTSEMNSTKVVQDKTGCANLLAGAQLIRAAITN